MRMFRDFSYRAGPRRQQAVAARRAFIAGFLTGTIALGLAWLAFGMRECPEPATATAPVAPVQPAGARVESAVTAPEPKFAYPQLLEKQEVVVTDADTERRAEPASPAPAVGKDDGKAKSPPPTDGTLLVQVAALRTAADAEALKARLAGLGLAAQVQPTRINNDTVHRVRLGPYGSLAQAKETQANLQRAGYASIVVREK
jgi:cell division protein FtsN